jgi:hypothetical protein
LTASSAFSAPALAPAAAFSAPAFAPAAADLPYKKIQGHQGLVPLLNPIQNATEPTFSELAALDAADPAAAAACAALGGLSSQRFERRDGDSEGNKD